MKRFVISIILLCVFSITASAENTLTISTNGDRNFFAIGQEIVLEFAIQVDEPSAKKGAVLFQAVDFFGEVQHQDKAEVTEESGATCKSAPFVLEPGFYRVRAMLKSESDTLQAKDTIAVIADGWETAGDTYYGTNGVDAPIIRKIGMGWVRMDVSWSSIERNQGVFDFTKYDNRVGPLLEQGMNILGILDYTPDWAARVPENWAPITDGVHKGWGHFPPKDVEEWGNFVYKTIKHYEGKITHWEVWNEPYPNTLFFNGGTAEDYVELLKVTYDQGRKACPDCIFVGLGGTHYSVAEKVFAAGGYPYMDYASIHHYQAGIPPEDGYYLDSIHGMMDVMDKYGRRVPVWITETGWPTHQGMSDMWMGVPEEDQARFLARTMLITMSEGISKVFWYTLENGGNDMKNFEQNQGLVYNNRHPKPAGVAYSTIMHVLKDATPISNLIEVDGKYAVLLSKGDGQILALWTKGKKLALDTNADPLEGAKYISLMGAELDPADGIEISGAVVYVLLDQKISKDEVANVISASLK